MWWSGGYVTVPVAGVLARATANATDPTEQIAVHSLLFQQVSGNVGKIYICSSNAANRSTGVGVLAVLAIPTTNVLPSASVTLTYAMNAINVADYWIDVDVGGDSVLVSYVVS